MKSFRRIAFSKIVFCRIVLVTIFTVSLALFACGNAAAGTLIVDINGGADFVSIQEAVSAAGDGDTVLVMPGTYLENLDVEKPLTIISESGSPDDTIVEAANVRDHVFYVNADNVSISGFTLKGARNEDDQVAGIYLDDVGGCTLSSNVLLDNYYGIGLKNSRKNFLRDNDASGNRYGIYLCISSSENELSGNDISGNYFGIYLNNACNNNILVDNTVESSRQDGISLISSHKTTVKNNTITSNLKMGIQADDSRANQIRGNVVSENGKGIFILRSSENQVTENSIESNSGSGVHLSWRSPNNTVEENRLLDNGEGILLADFARYNRVSDNLLQENKKGMYLLGHSDYNEISGNVLLFNSYGFYLEDCKENVFKDNIAVNNSECGILLLESFDNLIYNNYFKNTNNVDENKPNIWNTTLTSGTNIVGGSYLGGNCWAVPDRDGFSQTCEDLDEDGICDSVYRIEEADAADDTDVDELPLVYGPPVNSLIQNKAIMSESIEEEKDPTGANMEKEDAEKAPLGAVYPVGVFLIAFLISCRRRNE